MEYPKLIKEYQEIESNQIELEKEALKKKKKLNRLELEKKMKLSWRVLFESIVLFLVSNGIFIIGNQNGFEHDVVLIDPFIYLIITVLLALLLDFQWTERNSKFFRRRNEHESIITCLNFMFMFNIVIMFITILYFAIKGFYAVFYYIKNKEKESASDIRKQILLIKEEECQLKEKKTALINLIKEDSNSLSFINKLKKFDELNKKITNILEEEYKYENIIEHHIRNKEKEFMENF